MSNYSEYEKSLFESFGSYRQTRFSGQDDLFEDRPSGGVVVFRKESREANVLVPSFANENEQGLIRAAIPEHERHRWFGSMKSSQALAQSVFGTLKTFHLQPLLSTIEAENGTLAFGPRFGESEIALEKSVTTLGEPRPTSVDVWLDGSYRVAVECKLTEQEFGTCSRPRLSEDSVDFCDGSYTCQHDRLVRCSLTHIGIRYWDYMAEIFGWSPDEDHRPCPLSSTYQLARNILAACVCEDGTLDANGGHALVLYDNRNPCMQAGGKADIQWQAATGALRTEQLLTRLSWQSFVSQWPKDAVLDWLKVELDAKYGIRP